MSIHEPELKTFLNQFSDPNSVSVAFTGVVGGETRKIEMPLRNLTTLIVCENLALQQQNNKDNLDRLKNASVIGSLRAALSGQGRLKDAFSLALNKVTGAHGKEIKALENKSTTFWNPELIGTLMSRTNE